MLFVYALLVLALLVYCVLDVLTTPREAVRTLPKPLWLLLVLAPVFGPVAWFLAGRPERGSVERQPLRRPAAPPTVQRAPDDDEEFLRQLRKRAEEQRKRAQDPRDD